jgi:hypothetical protein
MRHDKKLPTTKRVRRSVEDAMTTDTAEADAKLAEAVREYLAGNRRCRVGDSARSACTGSGGARGVEARLLQANANG